MRGITVIEVIIVIAIIAILAATSTPFISRFILQTNMDGASDMLVSTIRKAQSYSMDGKGGTSWGVCLSGNAIRLFTGTCGAPTINEDYSVASSVTVTGLPSITFSSSRGEPSATFSAVVSSQIGSHTVSINSAGILTIN